MTAAAMGCAAPSDGVSTSDAAEGSLRICETAADLRDGATCQERLIGVALAARYLNEQPYAEAALEFNYVTPENEMKWGYNEPQPNVFDYTLGDAITEFAEQNGMLVKGHALVWHNQLPNWVNQLTTPEEVRAAMLNHIQQVVTHYRGRVHAWDVVNEAWGDGGTALRDSVFLRHLGPGYIDEAFIAARAADPDVKLYYNDYDTEDLEGKSGAVYEMVKGMVERGVPIDGVGLQMHVRIPDDEPSILELERNMQRIVDLGLEVVLSEIDVRTCGSETDGDQADRYYRIVTACLRQPGCTAVTVWGITDKYSWLNNRSAPQCPDGDPTTPLLWDDNYGKKRAYHGFMDALKGS